MKDLDWIKRSNRAAYAVHFAVVDASCVAPVAYEVLLAATAFAYHHDNAPEAARLEREYNRGN